MELRNRMFARVVSAGIVLGAVVAGPIVLSGTASAEGHVKGGSICGTVWHDLNEDGIRQAGEPVIANHTIGDLNNGTRYVNSGPDGRYCLTGLPEGEYVLQSNDRSLLDGTSWTRTGLGTDSKFTTTGLGYDVKDGNLVPIKITKKHGKYTHVRNFDSGFLTAKVDLQTWQILVDPTQPEGTVHKVGDVFEIYGSVANIGNAAEQLGGTLTLPEGLTILETAGGMPSYISGQQVIGNFHERRFAGDVEFVGAKVRVDKAFTGEVKLETARGVFQDINPANNVMTKQMTTVG